MSRDWERQIVVEDRYLEAISLLRDLEDSISWLTNRDEWLTLKEGSSLEDLQQTIRKFLEREEN